jgi:hypothetical protein
MKLRDWKIESNIGHSKTDTDLRRKIRIEQPTVRVIYDLVIDLTPVIEWWVDKRLRFS